MQYRGRTAGDGSRYSRQRYRWEADYGGNGESEYGAGKARRRQAGGLRSTDAEETDYGRGRRQVQVDYG